MVVPIYLTLIVGMRLRVASWWKTFLSVQITVAIIFSLNFIIDTNYMFLKAKLLVENPLLIGDWPFYILFLELFVFLLIALIYKLTQKKYKMKRLLFVILIFPFLTSEKSSWNINLLGTY